MGRADGMILDGGVQDNAGSRARVTDGELWVNVKTTVAGGGGAAGDVNIAEIGGNAVTTTIPVSGTVSVAEPVTVDGAVDVSGSTVDVGNFPAVQQVGDNGASLTVDGTVGISGTVDVTGSTVGAVVTGTVDIGNFPAVQPVSDNAGSLTVDDGGISLTVDGTVDVGNFPAVQQVGDNGTTLSVDDGAGSLTVDGTVGLSAQVNENDAVTGDPILVPIAVERDDSLSTLGEVDGDWTHARCDDTGAIWVRIKNMAIPLTGGTGDGRPIPISSTGSPGNVVHTVPANTRHKIFMNATNVSTTGRRITLRWGGTSTPGDARDFFVPPNSTITIANGDILVADGSTRVIYSSSTVANVVNLTGFVEVV